MLLSISAQVVQLGYSAATALDEVVGREKGDYIYTGPHSRATAHSLYSAGANLIIDSGEEVDYFA